MLLAKAMYGKIGKDRKLKMTSQILITCLATKYLGKENLDCQHSEKNPKHTRDSRERFLIGQNRAKRAKFQGSPFFKLCTT